MKHTGIQIRDYRIDKKTGKLVRVHKLDASAKIRQRTSKKITVKRGKP